MFLTISKIARRNILRNKKRSLITAVSVGLGLSVLILTDALIQGFNNYIRTSLTSVFSGQAQIHNENFIQTMQSKDTIFNSSQVMNDLKIFEQVEYFSPRLLSNATVTSVSDLKYVLLAGVDPNRERNLSIFDDCIIKGSYLTQENRNGILLGVDLANTLGVDTGDKVVITLARTNTGEIYQELFRVSGVFDTEMEEINKSIALVEINAASEMLGLNGEIHEIAVVFKDQSYSDDPDGEFFSMFSKNGNKSLSWKQIYPDIVKMSEMTDISTLVIAVIIFLVVGLGIVNTIFMSIYDRLFEFGVLRAIGARKKFIVYMILSETLVLSFWSVVVGGFLGLLITFILSKTGINYGGIEYESVLLKTVYPSLRLYQFIKYPVLLMIFSVLISLHPALYASRISLAKSVKKTL
ncbi:ABC transporter permease [candidate division WOR-3 bacterium]|nr:ABC transporter permease [candidate division WOR-3 bacterium]